jgi:hypothetical protein
MDATPTDFAEARRRTTRRSADPGSAGELLVTCTECGRLHVPPDPIVFSPVCSACTPPYPLGLLEMNGPFPLTHDAVDRIVRTAPGNYALGYRDGSTFLVFYVGRADADLHSSLRAWVGAPSSANGIPSAQAPWALRGGRCGGLAAPALASSGAAVDSSYTCFAYSFAEDAEAAFEKECRNFEDLGAARALDNTLHPAVLRDHASTGSLRNPRIRIVRSARAPTQPRWRG